MPKIFISYRRDDSIETAGRIYDQLAGHFGSENVFMDDYTIPPGVDFRKHLHDAVGGCDVVLAVIGRDWMKRRGLLRKRRLDDPGDFVRIEIEAALQRDVRVVPVLVRDATMPRPGDLPASIRDFAYRHAVRIRAGRDFRTDIDRLIGALEAVSPQPEAPSYSPPQPEAPPPEPLPPDVPPRVHEGALPAAPGPLTEPPMVAPAGEVVQAGEITTNSIGMKMVLIPAGEFLMGSPDSDNDASDDEKPQHRVKITRPFYLGVFPVTQDEYERVMRKTPSRFKGDPRRPVEMVSWTYAMEFCHRLSEKEDKQYRLPTEAEWEYACRAGSTTKWCFGDSESLLEEYVWNDLKPQVKRLALKTYLPNFSCREQSLDTLFCMVLFEKEGFFSKNYFIRRVHFRSLFSFRICFWVFHNRCVDGATAGTPIEGGVPPTILNPVIRLQ